MKRSQEILKDEFRIAVWKNPIPQIVCSVRWYKVILSEIIFSKKLEDVNLSVCFLHPKHKADLTLPLVTCHVPKDSIPPWVEFEDIQYG